MLGVLLEVNPSLRAFNLLALSICPLCFLTFETAQLYNAIEIATTPPTIAAIMPNTLPTILSFAPLVERESSK